MAPGQSRPRAGFRSCLAAAAPAAILASQAFAQGAPALALAGADSSPPGPGQSPPHGDDDLLLFEVRLGPVVLIDSFPAYGTTGGALLPLGQLCQELDLGIQVDPARGLAEGFIIQEARRFRLEARTGLLTVAGVSRTLDRGLMELHADDLYLDPRLLSQCLPLDLEVDPRSAIITVTPRETLPLQARWRREGQGGQLGPAPGPVSYPAMPDPYRLAEFPAVDATLSLGAQSAADGARPVSGQGSILAAGDLLYLTTDLFANLQNPGGVSDFHMSMGRHDPQGGLLGPLGATEFTFGEVQGTGLNLVAGSWGGTGVMVTNQPMRVADAYDRHSFRGDLPPGWQVELYRNLGLVGFQSARPDGRYEFLDIPLLYGLNDFRLVFYGPQGQRRQEVVQLDVSQSQTPPGVFHYQVVGLQAQAGYRPRSLFQASYGLGPQLTLLFGAARNSLGQVGRTYSELGLQGFWKPLAGSLTAALDDQGGRVGELAVRTRLGPLSLVGKRTEARDGFTSEAFQQSYGAIRSRTSLDTSAQLPSLEHPWLNVGVSGSLDQLAEGGSVDSLDLRLGTAVGRLFLSNEITRTGTHGLAVPAPAEATGAFIASTAFPALALRGQAGYTLGDVRRLDNLALTGETYRWVPYGIQGEADYTVASHEASLRLGLSKGRGAWSFGADLRYSTVSRWSAAFNVRLGLEREPRGRKFFSSAQGATNYGAVSVLSFLDANGNGRRDPGEPPVSNVAFNVNGSRHPRLAGKDGVVLLDGLPQDVDANISVATGSLEDPLMRPGLAGARFTPRRGHVARLEMPIVVFSEINGTAYRSQAGRKTELAGLRVELRDASGRVVKSLRTAYDGFFNMDGLPPGSYRLEVPEAAARRLGAAPPPPLTVVLSPEGSLLDGQDLILEVPEAGEP